MSDLSLWYERELSWFRKYAGQFADEHPGLARTLGISDEAVEDPDVARLVESFALLNARLSCQLNEELPQLTDALLHLLFPHFLRPLPSAGMMQLEPSADIGSIQQIETGSAFRARIDDDRYCDFLNCSPVQLLPFELNQAEVEQTPFSMQACRSFDNADAMLRLDLAMCDDSLQFCKAGELDYLDIHLKGELNLTQRLYDQLFSQVCGMALYDDSGAVVHLSAEQLQPVLMDESERILPLSSNTFAGYQLLLEYLSYQNLFLSLRIAGLKDVLRNFNGSKLSLAIYLKTMPVEMSRVLTAENFKLGCAPLVNLYHCQGEPIRIDHTRLGYPLVINARSANTEHVFSVDRMLDISGLKPEPVPEIYRHKYSRQKSIRQNSTRQEQGCYWHYMPTGTARGESNPQGEIALTDLNLNPVNPSRRQLSPKLTCSNGEQPLELSLQHELSCLENIAVPVSPKLLGKTSGYWSPRYQQSNRWVLLSHLQLNFETLLGAEDPALELREMLSLYNLGKHAGHLRCIDAINEMRAEQVVAPMKIQGRQCYVQGTEIHLTLDRELISGVSVMVFVQVLDRLFAGYAGHNSFSRLKVYLKGEPGVFYSCPRRHG
ncbi:type VI secretion system baseplate subunit TssF [Spongorhabdus nitratireducens]